MPEGSIAQVELNKNPSQKISILKGQEFLSKADQIDLNDGKLDLQTGAYIILVSP